MPGLSFRIYVTANLVIYLFFAIAFFPEGLELGFVALLYSAVFSAPTILLLLAGFALLQRLQPTPAVCWLLMLPFIATCALVPPLLLAWHNGDEIQVNTLFLPFSLGSAFTATLLQSFYLHRFFQSISNHRLSAINRQEAPEAEITNETI